MIVEIDYNPERDGLNSQEHNAWNRVVNKYHLLTISSDGNLENSRLLVPENLSLEQLVRDLNLIKILSSA